MEDDHRGCAPLLKNKFEFISSLCSSCCFRSGHRGLSIDDDQDYNEKPRLIKASSSWLRSRAHEFPEFKEKCRNLFCRIGKSRHRHHNSSDFRYDPLSYALNFDDGTNQTDDALADEYSQFNLRNFSARLPPSPPRSSAIASQHNTVVVPSEITACS